MRSTPGIRWFLATSLLGAVLGCRGGTVEKPDQKTGHAEADTSFQQALALLRRPSGETNYREALELLSTHVKLQAEANPALQKRLELSQEDRALLQERWKLSAGELAEVESRSYTSLDATHLELCLLMRDAARVVQAADPRATRRELARWSFAWAMREVRLREGRKDPLPPQAVLRQGEGTALERALVFLALLQQHDIDGCLVGCRDGRNEPFFWVAGALVENKGPDGKPRRDVLLFDTRLGLPVPGPGPEGVATLAEVRARPQLLPALPVDGKPAYGATAEQAAKAEVFLACPLSALSPRMRFLQGLLEDADRVRLAYDPAKLLARFAPEKVGVWDAAAADAPVRLARHFFPPEDGGTDKTKRAEWYRQKDVPWLLIRQSFPELPTLEAETQVARVVTALYKTYALKPHEMLLRGQFNEAARRLVRIRDEFQAEREARQSAGDVRAMRQEWGQQVQKAYIEYINARDAARQAGPLGARAQGDLQNAQKKVSGLLDDPYLINVVLGEDEIGLMQKEDEDQKKEKRPKKGLLTSVVLQSTMRSLGAEAAYLQALVRQERAEQVQDRLDYLTVAGPKPTAKLAREVAQAWSNARKGWDAYLAEFALTPAEVRGRLGYLNVLNPNSQLFLGTSVALLEDLFQDLAMTEQARLLRVRALEGAGQAGEARDALEKLPADLTALESVLNVLEKGAFQRIRKELNPRLQALEQQVGRGEAPREAQDLLNNLRHLSADLAGLEDNAWRGNVHWLRAAALARLRQLPPAKR